METTQTNIQPMTMADYSEAFALWESTAGIGVSAADQPQAIARYLARNPGMSFTARCAETRALEGTLLCGHDGRRGYLHHLVVRPQSRGRGIGRALVERGLAALQAEGIDKCHLFVYKENSAGRDFWTAEGWSERVTLVIMSKDIPLVE